MSYFVAQGKALNDDYSFKFVADHEDDHLKIFRNRRGKETLLMMQPNSHSSLKTRDPLLIKTPKQCFNLFRDITAGLYEYRDDKNNLCNYPGTKNCGYLKKLPTHSKVKGAIVEDFGDDIN